jgi:YbgC/YbaW family acyl-CoA thioester hydrolase
MSRTKVDLPKDFSFQTTIPIRITDVNYGGHVGNDTILTLLHEARMQFLKHHGFSEMDFGGAGLIMSDVIIEFKKEIFYGEEIKILVSVSNFSKIGFDVFYMVVKSQQEIVVAKAKTGMVCYDYKLRKIVSIPETALRSFK